MDQQKDRLMLALDQQSSKEANATAKGSGLDVEAQLQIPTRTLTRKHLKVKIHNPAIDPSSTLSLSHKSTRAPCNALHRPATLAGSLTRSLSPSF